MSVRVFVSYRHAPDDDMFIQRLDETLGPLEASGWIELWDDRGIEKGDQWDAKIMEAIDHAQVAILLISPSYLNSEYIRKREIPRILARASRGELRVIPIFLRYSLVDTVEFVAEGNGHGRRLTEFQGFATPDRPLSEMTTSQVERELTRLGRQLASVEDTTSFGQRWSALKPGRLAAGVLVLFAVATALLIRQTWSPAADAERLDALLGRGNWFVYPDERPGAVGVKRLPGDFRVRPPLASLTTRGRRFEPGDVVTGECGADVRLKAPLPDRDTPGWQKEAVDRWKEDRKRAPQITRDGLDRLFGAGNWRRDQEYPFAVQARLDKDLRVEYPITNVDAEDCLKYGVGMSPVKAGQGATAWLAGTVPP